jgi:hypothetical protein
MCFNGPKTYQLGWYNQYHVELPISGSFNWDGNLVGFAEKSSASWTDKMIIRIITSTSDIYIHFNRMTGMNIGTLEGGDHVLVTSRSTGLEYAESNLEAIMSAGSVHTISNIDGYWNSVTISVTSITTTTVPGYATVSIQCGESMRTSNMEPAPIATHESNAFLKSQSMSSESQILPQPYCNFNSVCELGEDCNSCPFDCNGRPNHFCCAGDICNNVKCNINGWHCT